MSFIQAEDNADAEKQMSKLKAAFVSPDHRLYEEIEFWDEFAVWHIPAKTLLALYNLQTSIEQMTEGDRELYLGDLRDAAKEFDDAFNAVVTAIGFKPIRKRGK
jgi:hypothetical protein